MCHNVGQCTYRFMGPEAMLLDLSHVCFILCLILITIKHLVFIGFLSSTDFQSLLVSCFIVDFVFMLGMVISEYTLHGQNN